VLYEMLTGRRTFPGDDLSDTLAEVLKGEPDWNALSDDVPEHIRLLLRRSLEKDRNRRVADISIARFLVTEPVVGAPRVTPSVQTTITAAPRSLLRRALPLGLTAIVMTGMTAAVMWNLRPSTVPPISRFPIVLPERQQFALRSQVLAVSPDGSQIVYVGGSGQLEALFLSAVARNYDITPDGKQFVVITPAGVSAESSPSSAQQINLVLNWFEELKRLVPAK
jgi:eukaryotic-like serine/threonine-protein kinase